MIKIVEGKSPVAFIAWILYMFGAQNRSECSLSSFPLYLSFLHFKPIQSGDFSADHPGTGSLWPRCLQYLNAEVISAFKEQTHNLSFYVLFLVCVTKHLFSLLG